jgi:hypothetical protein
MATTSLDVRLAEAKGVFARQRGVELGPLEVRTLKRLPNDQFAYWQGFPLQAFSKHEI